MSKTQKTLKGNITKAADFFTNGDIATAVLRKRLKDVLIIGDANAKPEFLFGDYSTISKYILQNDTIEYTATTYKQFNLSFKEIYSPTQAQEKLLLFSPKISIFKMIDKKRILGLTKNVQFVRFKKDEIVFNQGNKGKEIYIILSGTIALYNDDNPTRINKSTYLTTLKQGAIVGEMAPFTGETRSAKAIVDSQQCILLKFEINEDKGHEADLLLLYKNALKSISEKLRVANADKSK